MCLAPAVTSCLLKPLLPCLTASDYTHNIDPSIGSAHPAEHEGGGSGDSAIGAEPDSRAMEAVYQLAQAASQQSQHQQHGHTENPPVHQASLPSDKTGSKRRTSQGSPPSTRPIKYARQDGSSAEDSFQIPESWAEGVPDELQTAYQQHLASGAFPAGATSNDNVTDDNRPIRQLSTSKRAAQNRAAQRAFRERRDKYVKVLEAKALRLEQAVRVATECKRRYIETLHTVAGLRADNHTLRVALGALSGSQAGPAPTPMKIDDYLESLPTIPPVTTEEEEALFPSGNTASNGIDPLSGTDLADTRKDATGGNPSLHSLSAAAAAIQSDAAIPQQLPKSSPVPSSNTTSTQSAAAPGSTAQSLPPVPTPPSASNA